MSSIHTAEESLPATTSEESRLATVQAKNAVKKKVEDCKKALGITLIALGALALVGAGVFLTTGVVGAFLPKVFSNNLTVGLLGSGVGFIAVGLGSSAFGIALKSS